MANTDKPFGFKPLRHKNGAPYNGATRPYYISASYGTALYVGDPVVIMSTGSNSAQVGEYPAGTLQRINRATAGSSNYVTGVIVGFEPLRTDLSKQYNPASTERVAYVADDPDLVFIGQEDSASDNILAADIGLNANIVFTHAGSTVTGLSKAEIDSSSNTTNSTAQLKILGLHNTPGNEIASTGTTAQYGVFEFMINLHTQRYASGI